VFNLIRIAVLPVTLGLGADHPPETINHSQQFFSQVTVFCFPSSLAAEAQRPQRRHRGLTEVSVILCQHSLYLYGEGAFLYGTIK
jgi:hypothetical protein